MAKNFSPRGNGYLQGSQSLVNNQSSMHLHDDSMMEQSRTIKPQPTFTSVVPREFLDSVSKEIRVNPGPGSYLHDQLMKDKMRALSFQVCQRY